MNGQTRWIVGLGCSMLVACAHAEQNLEPAAMAHAAGHVPEAAME